MKKSPDYGGGSSALIKGLERLIIPGGKYFSNS